MKNKNKMLFGICMLDIYMCMFSSILSSLNIAAS